MVETVVTQLTIDARGAEVGSALYIKATNAAQAAADALIDRQARLDKAVNAGQFAMTASSTTISRLSKDYQRLQDAVDPTAAKLRRAGEELNRVKVIADDARLRLGRPIEEVNAIIDVAIGKYRTLQNSIVSAQAAASQQQVNKAAGFIEPGANTQSRGEDIAAYGRELDKTRAKFDPLFAAQQRYREELGALRSALATGAINENVYANSLAVTKAAFVERTNALGLFSTQQRKAAAEVEAASAAEVRARDEVTAAAKREREAQDLASRGKRFAAAADPQFAAQERYNDTVREAKTLLDAGAISSEHYAAGLAQASTELAKATAENSGLMATLRQAATVFKQNEDAARKAAEATADLAARAARLSASVDPQIAARQTYNAALAETRDLLAKGAISQEIYAASLAKASGEFRKATAENSGLLATLRDADAAFKRQAEAAKITAAGMAQFEADLKRVKAEINPSAAALDAYNARLKLLSDLQRSGHITQQELSDGTLQARKVYADTERSIAGLNVATSKWTNGNGLARHELINLGRQGQDVFVSLASGQNILTVAIQQGTQIFDVFASSQARIGAVFKDLALTLLRFAPIIGAVVAGVGALYSAFSVAGERLDLSNSLLGAGRAAGVAGADFDQLAVAAAAAAGTTASNARLIAAEYTKLGTVARDNLPQLTKLTKDYAAQTGQDLPTAAKELARAFADPAKGAETLNEKLGLLDSTTIRAIRTAVDYGDKLRATKLLMDAVAASTVEAEQTQSKFNQVYEKFVTRPVAALKEGIGNELIAPNTVERVKQLDERLASLRQKLSEPVPSGVSSPVPRIKNEIAQAQALRDQLDAELSRSRKSAEESQKTIQGNQRTAAGEQLLQGAQKESLAYQLATRNVSVYEAALGELVKRRADLLAQGDVGKGQDAQKLANFNEQIKDQSQALEKAKNQLKDYSGLTSGLTVEQDKAQRADKVRLESAGDVTKQQREATAAKLAAIEALYTETTAQSRAEAAAKAKRDIDIESAKTIADAKRASNDNIVSLDAQAAALRRTGVAASEVERLKQAAIAGARASGEPEQAAVERALAARLAETNRQLEERVRQSKDVATAEGAATAAAQKAGASDVVRAQILAKIQAVEQQRQALLAAGVTDQAQIAAALSRTAGAIDAVNDAQTKAKALGLIYGQNEQIAGIEKEIALLGQSRDVRREQLAVLQAEQDLRRQGIAIGSEEGQIYVANARKISALNTQFDKQRQALDQVRQAQDFVADGFKSFVDELITGTDGINGALKSLGKGFLSSSLDAIISGKGPLAGITGLASGDKEKQGGVLGLLQGNSIGALSKAVETGAKKGTEVGAEKGIGAAGDNGGFNIFGGTGINGAQLAGGLTAIAGLAGAYGTGAAASSTGVGVAGGALSGAVGGAALGTAILPGIGTAIGAVAGAIAGGGLAFLGGSSASTKAKAEREKQAQDNYKQAQSSITSFRSQARGDPQGTLQQTIATSEASARQLYDVAFLAKRFDEAKAIYDDFLTYEKRTLDKFSAGWYGLLDSLNSGLGPDSPFAQARDKVESLGESLKAFISNTEFAFAGDTGKADTARAAARSYALSVFNGGVALSNVATRLQEISGTASGLKQVLGDLGLTADEAAAAISTGVTAAIARLKATFEGDLLSKTNDARGAGYLNDISSLISEIATLRADAASLGTDQGLVTDYFSAKAQEIVNGANLTGAAFDSLISRFPNLAGVVREAGVTIDAAARAIEAASRKVGYLDRIFAALNDTSTLAGQLAAFDRTAQTQRAEEIRLGGDAINELEGALAAERLKIITNFADAAVAEQKRALEEAQNFFDTFSRNLRQFVDGLRSGSESPLSPEARLAAARSQFDAQYALSLGGDRDAINSLTTYASALIEANKAFNASSLAGQSIYNEVLSKLETLPTQVSAEQFIVDAIKSASTDTIAAIDTNGDGFISLQEATNAGLGSIFRELDTNGDGQISALELIRGATQSTAGATDYQNTILAQTQQIVGASQNLLNASYSLQASSNAILGTQASLLEQIRSLNGTSTATLAALQGQFGTTNTVNFQGVSLTNNMVESLNKIVFNTANTVIALKQGTAYTYADGGRVVGPGTGTSDSISAQLSNGEFVVKASAAARNLRLLEAINGGSKIFRDVAVPVPVPVPFGSASSTANDNSAADEIRGLRAEVRELRSAIVKTTIAAAEHVREGIDQNGEVQESAAREMKAKRRG